MKDKIDYEHSAVILGMSGGLDSSVAAALLQEQGYDVTGVIMKIWSGEPVSGRGKHGCYGPGKERDIEDARRVAAKLDIPLHVIDLSEEFKSGVLDYFCREYLAGRTPNPCIRCNRSIKFGALLEKAAALSVEYDYFATGHYSRIYYDENRKRYLLKKGRDLKKDQSYFLFGLSQEQLGRTLFPLGGLLKDDVRSMSKRLGLGVEDKNESQNFVCGSYSSLFKASTLPGPIMDGKGRVIGEHCGIEHFTVGQRRGLRLASKEPLYVIHIDAGKNAVVVGPKEDLYVESQVVAGVNWVAFERLESPLEVTAKIRSTHHGYAASISPDGNERVKVTYKGPQIGAAPGQAIVFYDKDTVIGGGIVE